MATKKKTHGGVRSGSGRKPIEPMDKKYTVTMQVQLKHIKDVSKLPTLELLDNAVTSINSKKNKLIESGVLHGK